MFALESTRFIEQRVLEECIQLKNYTKEFVDQSVDAWSDIVGIDGRPEWKEILIPQLKKEIYTNLQEGKYFYAAL